jgi:glycosyltransferase involved in cell wall biosynthesis
MIVNPPEPVISVLMPAYNAGRYLSYAIDSVLSQTYGEFELIVVDDGSIDNTFEIASTYSRKDKRVIAVKCGHAGNIVARNKCLELARASIVGWLDADDLAHPEWLSAQLDYMNHHPECVAVGCQTMLFWGDHWPIGVFNRPLEHEEIDAINLTAKGGGIMNGAVLMRRWAIDQAGGFDESMETVEDMHLILQLAEIGKLANLPDILFWRRVHLGSVSHSRTTVQYQMKQRAAHLAAERRGLPFHEVHEVDALTTTLKLLLNYMRYSYYESYFETAIRIAIRVLLIQPWNYDAWRILIKGSRKRKLIDRRSHIVFPDFDQRKKTGGAQYVSSVMSGDWYHEPVTPADTSRRAVILYNPPNSGMEEAFWPKLRVALREQGYELYSVGSVPAKTDLPHIQLPYTLDEVRSSQTLITGRLQRSQLDLKPILDRELFFTGVEGDRVVRINAAYQMITAQARILAQLKPRIVLFWNGEQTHQLILKQLLKHTNCPTLRLERSPFPGILYTDKKGLMADASIASKPIDWKDSAEKSVWMERYHEYVHKVISSNCTWWGSETGMSQASLGNISIPVGSVPVLFAGQVNRDTQNLLFSPYFNSNIDAFKAFCDMSRKSGKVFIIGKHHPKSDIPADEYRRIIEGVGVWLTDISLERCFDMVDCVAAVNSSILFEAALRGKRCLALGKTIIKNRKVFYEYCGPEDTNTFQDWLDGCGYKERNKSWEELIAWHFANHFYSMYGAEIPGLKSEQELAHSIINMSS